MNRWNNLKNFIYDVYSESKYCFQMCPLEYFGCFSMLYQLTTDAIIVETVIVYGSFYTIKIFKSVKKQTITMNCFPLFEFKKWETNRNLLQNQ